MIRIRFPAEQTFPSLRPCRLYRQVLIGNALGLTGGSLALKEAKQLFEREYVAQILAEHRGNASQAAKALGISRVMLQKKIKQYDLRRDPQNDSD